LGTTALVSTETNHKTFGALPMQPSEIIKSTSFSKTASLHFLWCSCIRKFLRTGFNLILRITICI